MNKKTNLLTPTFSFLRGASHVIDIGATLDVFSIHEDEVDADTAAIYSDWYIVGQDLFGAIKFEKANMERQGYVKRDR